MKTPRNVVIFALSIVLGGNLFGAYNVRRPSDAVRPRWSGASVGEWTMDFQSAKMNSISERRFRLVLVDAGWWCPFCEVLEEKVLTSAAWSDYVADRGFYLSMLDFPYRGAVKPEELSKSRYPELGAGWGFQCWLYDDGYLAENSLTREDGFRAITEMYALQDSLGVEGASQVTINSWDGSSQITYKRVGYPTIIVYLPDGREAGRFSPNVRSMESAEAQEYVINRIESIIAEAIDQDCGLCTDTDEALYAGDDSRVYNGWVEAPSGGLAGLVKARTTKRNWAGKMTFNVELSMNGKTTRFKKVSTNSAENVVFEKADKRLVLTFASHGMQGVCDVGGMTNAQVVGAIDCYKCGDSSARAYVEGVTPGKWSFVMKPINPSTSMDRGFGTMTIDIAKKGDAKISGYMGDGRRVSLKSKVIVGETGVYCLPVYASLYTRKEGGFSCIIWFKNGAILNVTDIGEWRSTGKTQFSTRWKPVFSPLPGSGAVEEEMELIFQTPIDTVDGMSLEESPDYDIVNVNGRKWSGTDVSRLQLRLAPKGNELSGGMYFNVMRDNGRARKIRATVRGVVSGGIGYVTVVRGGKEAWAVKISSCTACSD